MLNHKHFTLLEHVEFQSQGRKHKVIYKAVQLHYRDKIEKKVHLEENSKKGVISESFHVTQIFSTHTRFTEKIKRVK